MRGVRIAVAVTAALMMLGAGLPAGAAPAGRAPADRAPAGTAPGYVEDGSDNPVTAAPPVSRPDTRHCVVTLADRFPSNAADGSPQTFNGTLTPPPACAGPWAKVVLDETISVSGRQYDRSGDLTIGGTEVYFGTTEEPSGAVPTTYHVAKDVTEFGALLRNPQPFHGGIGNYVTDVYTGNYLQTVTLTYYVADRHHPAPAEPDAVVGFTDRQATPAADTVHFGLSNLPRNITRARLSVTLKGNGCDEQWFSSVPDSVAAKYPDAGMCPHGPYREADAALDGTPMGAVHTFPHIYSGGIVPTLWRPVPAIGTFSLRAEDLDITPFVGRLVDGGAHDLSIRIPGANDTWDVIATLFLDTDHEATRTSGALTTDTVPPVTPATTTTALPDNGTRVRVAADRHDVTAGYVDTSAGRIRTTVTRDLRWLATDDVTAGGMAQRIRQSDVGSQTVRTAGPHGSSATRHGYSYPLGIDFSAADYTDDQNFSLTGTVEQTLALRDEISAGRAWRTTAASTEWLRSTGLLSRSAGVTSASDGSSATTFRGSDDAGRPYRRSIVTDHGRIVSDRPR